ncbi:carboxypeptidase M32 [Tistrella mobilis]|uniref:carboxypeptidase M32 n=1 Tax=Tistrella mobilis TaxID=171437 RepID=UPI003634D388
MPAMTELEARFRRLSHIEGAEGVLSWDWAVNMPKGGATVRAAQMATLAEIGHDILTAPDLPALFDDAAAELAAGAPADQAGADRLGWQQANLAEMRRRHAHATALPADLVRRRAEAASTSEMIWREARAADDFARFAPALAQVLKLEREAAAAKGAALGLPPYEALLDAYDPGRRTADIDRIFARLEAELPVIRDAALAAQAARPQPVRPQGPFPVAAQRALGIRLMTMAGFPFDHGRLDVSHHPFSGGVPDDLRITTRYDEADFAESAMAVLHETGHALYEHGLPRDWRDQPVGLARGMTIHESQSLLTEMQASRSRPFMTAFAAAAREAFGAAADDPAYDADNLHALMVRVRPGFIRVNADEVTYPGHVMLRYGLERAMIAGDLAVDDLPGAWREGMARLVGVVPDTDRDGCLQDIHWPSGAFGYFPTYSLGAMAAAQLFQAARRALPALDDDLARGDFSGLLGWLRTHVHGQGCRWSADELIERATGAPLSADAFLGHLRRRYLGDGPA